jgi:hypothetical protein
MGKLAIFLLLLMAAPTAAEETNWANWPEPWAGLEPCDRMFWDDAWCDTTEGIGERSMSDLPKEFKWRCRVAIVGSRGAKTHVGQWIIPDAADVSKGMGEPTVFKDTLSVSGSFSYSYDHVYDRDWSDWSFETKRVPYRCSLTKEGMFTYRIQDREYSRSWEDVRH